MELYFSSVEKKMYFWDTETELASWEDPEEEKKTISGSVTMIDRLLKVKEHFFFSAGLGKAP